MKNNLKLICFIMFLGLSCNKDKKIKDDSMHYFNDLESLDGWAEVPTLSNEKARSGLNSSKVDMNNPYSIGFRKKLSTLSSKDIKQIEINAWVLVTDPSVKSFIACSIDSVQGASPIIYLTKIIDFKNQDLNSWMKVSGDFYLPKNMNQDNYLLVYFWNTSPKGAIFVDDIEIKLTEY